MDHNSPITNHQSPITGVGTNHQSPGLAPITNHQSPVTGSNHQSRFFWYAVRSKPRQEAVAEENLVRQGFHVYLPRLCIRRRRRGQWIDSIEVLFPRYLFIRVDPLQQDLAPVRSTRGAAGLVRFGGQPAVVPDEVVDALLRCQDPASGFHQENRTPFSSGDCIKLVDGPFAGMNAVFAEPDGEKRVIVLLELLGKTNQVRVSRDWVARAA